MVLNEETLKSIVSFATKEISKERSMTRKDLVNEIEDRFMISEYESLSVFVRENFYELTSDYDSDSLREAFECISLDMILDLENAKRERDKREK